jgi:hypothetical protein
LCDQGPGRNDLHSLERTKFFEQQAIFRHMTELSFPTGSLE